MLSQTFIDKESEFLSTSLAEIKGLQDQLEDSGRRASRAAGGRQQSYP